MTISRSDKSGFAAWWWTTDRVAFSAVIVLIALGLMLACAASPAATGSAFTAGDWRRLLTTAGIPPGAAAIRWWFPFRWCVTRIHRR